MQEPVADPKSSSGSETTTSVSTSSSASNDADAKEPWGRRAGAWARRWWRALLSEVICGFQIEWFSRLATLSSQAGQLPPRQISILALGGAVFVNIQTFRRISGGFGNPTVTIAALVAGRIDWRLAAGYIMAQCAGCVAGLAAWRVVVPAALWQRPPCDSLEDSIAEMIVGEAVLVSITTLFTCSAWRPYDLEGPPRPHPIPSPDPLMAVKFGLLVPAVAFSTDWMRRLGGFVNPAQGVAFSVMFGCWRHHWVYWLGSGGGACAAAALYRYVLVPIPAQKKKEVVL